MFVVEEVVSRASTIMAGDGGEAAGLLHPDRQNDKKRRKISVQWARGGKHSSLYRKKGVVMRRAASSSHGRLGGRGRAGASVEHAGPWGPAEQT